MLDLGKKNIYQRAQLASIETPPATDTWTPIPHTVLVDKVTQQVENLGYKITDEGYTTRTDGLKLYGHMTVSPVEGEIAPDYSMMIGIKNSNDKKFPVVIGLGNHVFICSNGMFVAETFVSRKHTKFIMNEIDERINDALSRLMQLGPTTDARIKHYKDIEVSRRERDDLALTALRADIIPGRSFANLIKELDNPTHEFRNDQLWGVYNCFTEKLKVNPVELQDNTMRLTQLVDNRYGFDPSKVQATMAV